MDSVHAIEFIKTRAFLMQQEGLKRRRGDVLAKTEKQVHDSFLLVNTGTRVMAHINSGATVTELLLTRAYEDMAHLESIHDIVG